MNIYTVKEVANMLNVTEEQVRRWIRSGELNSTINSKKEGHRISEDDLKAFVKIRSKYTKIIFVEVDDTRAEYLQTLTYYLDMLMAERDRLEKRIARIQKLIEDES